MPVFYPSIPASDGAYMSPAVNAVFEVFELSDAQFTTPLALTTSSGGNGAPLITTELGVTPPIYVDSPNLSHNFKSGSWVWRRDSFDGAAEAVETAKTAAVAAARAAEAPTDTKVDEGIQRANLPKLAAEAVAESPTVTAAAAEAVGEEISKAELVRSLTAPPVEDVAGGILDSNGRATWQTHTASGGPTEYALARMGITHQEGADATGGFLDSNGRVTWQTHTASGGPTEYAVAVLRKALALDREVTTPVSTTQTGGNRHAMLENELRLVNGGTLRTGGAAPVVLICDHGANLFRDILLPLLVARGLPSVLALNGNMHKPGYNIEAESKDVTWAEINGWASVEVSNHGASHTNNAVSQGQLYAEIVGSLEELKANLPAKRILTWTQPAIDFPGFNNGNTTATWTDTEAGRLIYEHHAVATGMMRSPAGSVYPRDGNILQGIQGLWLDGAGTSTDAMARIRTASTNGQGIILRLHPRNINASDAMTTTAELTTLLDFLKAEQDAKRVRVVNLSQWSIADTGK